jgi:hypothetical protein
MPMAGIAAGHRGVPHTADLRIEAWAPSRDGCIRQAVLGTVHRPRRVAHRRHSPSGGEAGHRLGDRRLAHASLSGQQVLGVAHPRKSIHRPHRHRSDRRPLVPAAPRVNAASIEYAHSTSKMRRNCRYTNAFRTLEHAESRWTSIILFRGSVVVGGGPRDTAHGA